MRFFKKILSGVLILSLLCLYFPQIGLAGQSRLIAKAANTAITKHKPQILAPPEEDIPVEKAAKPKTKKWVWYALGAVVLIGGIAAAGGGGGGGGDSPTTGNVTVSW